MTVVEMAQITGEPGSRPNSTRPTTSKRAVFISTCCDAVCTSRQHRSMGHEVCAEFMPAASATRSTACTASFTAGYYGESRMRAVLDAEALARLALPPNLVAATVEVCARRLQQTFRLRVLGLCEGTLAQSGASSRRHFGLRDFVQRIERVACSAEHHRYQMPADKLQLQRNDSQRTALPWRPRVEPIEGEFIREQKRFRTRNRYCPCRASRRSTRY